MIETATITVKAAGNPTRIFDDFGNTLHQRIRVTYEHEWTVTLQYIEDVCNGEDVIGSRVLNEYSTGRPNFDTLCREYLQMRGYTITPNPKEA